MQLNQTIDCFIAERIVQIERVNFSDIANERIWGWWNGVHVCADLRGMLVRAIAVAIAFLGTCMYQYVHVQ